LLAEDELPLRVFERRAFLDLLGPQDEPWVRVLRDELRRFEGRRQRELVERLGEPLPCAAPHFKRRAATRVLLRLWRRERVAAVSPIDARAHLFAAAAQAGAAMGAAGGPALLDGSLDRATIVARTAAALGLASQALEEALFADLPGERVVRAPEPIPEASELVLRTNLAIAQAVLMRAAIVHLRVEGAVRPLVRLAKLRGLLCTVNEATEGALPVLELSGPYALFRHTLLYGRALAALLPQLAWTARFELRASVRLRGRVVDVDLASGMPLFPAAAPAPFDSRLEERFAADLGKLTTDWDILREPEPVRAGGTLVFPDFLLRHRVHTGRRVLVELVGFWTPEYLARKLAGLREAAAGPLILCVDEARACAAERLAPELPIVPYRRRVDAAAVLALAERVTR
jgi:hypothetical protein